MFDRVVRCVAWSIVAVAVLLPFAKPIQAAGQPTLYLPTPPGETWEIIQGYNCGSHDGWGRLSFDLVNYNGRTRGAPVSAAADGTIFYHGGSTNSLILRHENGYYTMYSHMQTVIDAPTGTAITRGQWIGNVGSVNPSPTVPHLHFTFFKADGTYANNRRPVALAFAEGYDFPDEGTCNNHGDELVVASGEAAPPVEPADTTPPTIEWTGSAEKTWLVAGRVDWTLSDTKSVRGFSQAWDAAPASDAPQYVDRTAGYLELAKPGVHTIFIRAWDNADNQAVFTRELWYDPIAPTMPSRRATASADVSTASPGKPVFVQWQPGSDADSGIKGYQVYVGSDAHGTSDWFTAEPQVEVGKLGVGRYTVRVRSQDNAGNFSDWATVETVDVKDAK